MTPEEIIEHNRNLIQKVLGRPFMYKPFAPYETREEFEKQVDERREAEYLERVYGIKNEFRNELSISEKSKT
jgi:predicted NodU family carbamoyl transferase